MKKKFRVTATYLVHCSADIEAESEQEAMDKVGDDVNLFSQDGGEYDYWEAEEIEDGE